MKKLVELIDGTLNYTNTLRNEIPGTIERLEFIKQNLNVVPYIPEPVNGEINLQEDSIRYWWVFE